MPVGLMVDYTDFSSHSQFVSLLSTASKSGMWSEIKKGQHNFIGQ